MVHRRASGADAAFGRRRRRGTALPFGNSSGSPSLTLAHRDDSSTVAAISRRSLSLWHERAHSEETVFGYMCARLPAGARRQLLARCSAQPACSGRRNGDGPERVRRTGRAEFRTQRLLRRHASASGARRATAGNAAARRQCPPRDRSYPCAGRQARPTASPRPIARYLAQAVAARTGLPQADAEKRVNRRHH